MLATRGKVGVLPTGTLPPGHADSGGPDIIICNMDPGKGPEVHRRSHDRQRIPAGMGSPAQPSHFVELEDIATYQPDSLSAVKPQIRELSEQAGKCG